MARTRWVVLAIGAWALGSCSSGVASVAADAVADAAADSSVPDVPADAGGGLDLGTPDIPWDADVTADLALPDSGCAPGSGCFLDPCLQPSDCLSGLCVPHLGDSVCSMPCVEECPDGWTCKLIDGLGPDPMQVCISDVTTLCLPCAANADCAVVGIPGVCIDYGAAGSFCGAECADGVCPPGFSCMPAHSVDGSTSKQCVSDAGECACSATAVALGLSTPCEVTSEIGVCVGKRTCGPQGLSACDAKTPAEETCNGMDDDCDGDADEQTCDDANPCTKDSCDPATGCQNTPVQGGCDDQDVCTVADHCDQGVCVGEPIDCSDGNPCTYDNCDAKGGCVYTYNTMACDDGDPCTVADACSKGACAGVAVSCDCQEQADCLKLEDGNVCNGTLACDTAVLPHKCVVDLDTIVACPPASGTGKECLEPTCNPVTGECGLAPANDGGACNDANACTFAEACVKGACTGGVPPNCNDSNPCTTDWCDPGVGCVHDDNSAPCSDDNICTAGDHCADGQCVPGDLLQCDDANPCTADTCQPGIGCSHAALEGPCDDGNSCTTGDACAAGQCKGVGSLECDDANPCTKDVCLPQGGCAHEPLVAGCSDGNPCTVSDQCVNGVCTPGTPIACDDANPCTTDSCNGGACVHTPAGGLCSDGNACSVGDHCEEGECVPEDVVDCNDANQCTTDWCDPAVGCTHTHNKMPCNDSDACTQGESCLAGVCQGGNPVACNDSNPCTTDACISPAGCLHTPNQAPCNDANPCTVEDTCGGGACLGGPPLDCSDSNPCTDDSCDPAKGCVHAPNASPCDDGNSCTTVDVCQAGTCKGSGAPVCDDANMCTVDSCSPDAGCIHDTKPMQGKPCVTDEQGVCGTTGSCNLGSCIPSGLACDDGNPCTDDTCDPLTGACQHAANNKPCDDSNPCTDADTCTAGTCLGMDLVSCDDGNPCTTDKCSPLSGCQNTNNTLPCNDNDACTTSDACFQGVCTGSGTLNCNDGNVCTTDTCDPATGCGHLPAVGQCDDGNICTPTDTCVAGQCSGAGSLDCGDGNACTTDACDPKLGCTHAPKSPCCGNGAKEAGEECDDGNLSNGDGCSSKCALEPLASCKAIRAKFPTYGSGDYTIDPDAAGPVAPLVVRCDMTTDGGGYTMVRFNDGALAGGQDTYRAYCAARGMEVICPRTKAHAMSIQSWNNGEPPNLVNVFPKYNGAYGLSNWNGRCQGQSCGFWMSDSDSCGCTNFEPNGDNDTGNALYRRTTGCDFGNWNDAGGTMDIHGWVICSTNDK